MDFLVGVINVGLAPVIMRVTQAGYMIYVCGHP